MSQRSSSNRNCYVCGGQTGEGCYQMSKARTQVTRIKLSERLSQLLGDNFMMVLSKDDVICRCCASMLNSLDRLEKDVWVIKSILLRVLGKRYNLPEDEVMEGGVHDVLASGVSTQEVEGQSVMITGNDNDEWLACDRCQFETTKKLLDASKEQVKEMESEPENNAKGSESSPKDWPESIAVSSTPHKPKVDQTMTFSTPGPAFGELQDLDLLKNLQVPLAALSPEQTPKQSEPDTPKEELQVSLELLDTEDGPAIFLVTQDGVILNKVEQTEDGTSFVYSDNELRVLKFNEDDTIELLPASFALSPKGPGSTK